MDCLLRQYSISSVYRGLSGCTALNAIISPEESMPHDEALENPQQLGERYLQELQDLAADGKITAAFAQRIVEDLFDAGEAGQLCSKGGSGPLILMSSSSWGRSLGYETCRRERFSKSTSVKAMLCYSFDQTRRGVPRSIRLGWRRWRSTLICIQRQTITTKSSANDRIDKASRKSGFPTCSGLHNCTTRNFATSFDPFPCRLP